jgi:hypothetical protein
MGMSRKTRNPARPRRGISAMIFTLAGDRHLKERSPARGISYSS